MSYPGSAVDPPFRVGRKTLTPWRKFKSIRGAKRIRKFFRQSS